MNRYTKLFVLFLCIALVAGAGVTFWYINGTHQTAQKAKWKNSPKVTGRPGAAKEYTFPGNNPQFSVNLESKKTLASSTFTKQQSVAIYLFGGENKLVFKRDFYADGFKGFELMYSFSPDTQSFTQSGSLGSVGCMTNACKVPWSNYYQWDEGKKTFALVNSAHKDFYRQLLVEYAAINRTGLKDSEVKLLQNAENTAMEILQGKNLGSSDIR